MSEKSENVKALIKARERLCFAMGLNIYDSKSAPILTILRRVANGEALSVSAEKVHRIAGLIEERNKLLEIVKSYLNQCSCVDVDLCEYAIQVVTEIEKE